MRFTEASRQVAKAAALPRVFRRAEGPAVCLAQAGRPGLNAPTSLFFRRAVSPAVCPGAPVGSGLRRDARPSAAAPPGSRRSVREACGNWPGLQPSEPRWGMLKPSPRGLGYANCRAFGPPEYVRQLGDLAAFCSVPRERILSIFCGRKCLTALPLRGFVRRKLPCSSERHMPQVGACHASFG